jgi:hypothetical protein
MTPLTSEAIFLLQLHEIALNHLTKQLHIYSSLKHALIEPHDEVKMGEAVGIS